MPPIATPSLAQQRLLHNSGRAGQRATAQASAPSSQPPPTAQAPTPTWTYDATSSLSPSEQREKAHRQRLRQQAEEREAARQAEECKRKEEERLAKQRHVFERAISRPTKEGGRPRPQTQQAQRSEQQRAARLGQARAAQRRDADNRARGPGDRRQTRGDQGQMEGNEQPAKEDQSLPGGFNLRKQFVRPSTGNTNQPGYETHHLKQQQPKRGNDTGAGVASTAKRTSMPSFGGKSEEEEKTAGWGRASTETKPLQYKTDEQIQADIQAEKAARIAARAPPARNPNITSAPPRRATNEIFDRPRDGPTPSRLEHRRLDLSPNDTSGRGVKSETRARQTEQAPAPIATMKEERPSQAPVSEEQHSSPVSEKPLYRAWHHGPARVERPYQAPVQKEQQQQAPVEEKRQYQFPVREERPPQAVASEERQYQDSSRMERAYQALAREEAREREVREHQAQAREERSHQARVTEEQQHQAPVGDERQQYKASARDEYPYQAPTREERQYHIPAREERLYQAPAREEGQYQAIPLKSSEFQSSINNFDDGMANTWQHLRPQSAAPPPSPIPPPPPPPKQAEPSQQGQRELYPIDDEDVIDRQFREHKRRRDMQAQQARPLWPPRAPVQAQDNQSFSPPGEAVQERRDFPRPDISHPTAPTTPEFRQTPVTRPLRCARCLEEGHVARDCEGPVKATCNKCGQVGHMKKDCPKERARVQRTDRFDADRNDRRSDNRGNLVRRTSSRQQDLDSESLNIEDNNDHRYRRVQNDEPETFAAPITHYTPAQQSPASEQSYQDRQRTFTGQPAGATEDMADVEEEVVDDASERRARRSRRGFEDLDEEETPAPRTFDRRKEGRPKRRETDEDADDEAIAAREERAARKAAKKAQEKADSGKRKAERAAGQREGGGTQVQLPEFVSVSNLAQQLDVGYEPFVKRLEELGYDDVFPGKVLNREISGMIAMEYNFEPMYETNGSIGGKSQEEERDLKPAPEVEDTEFLPTRPPVVTIMGHVDHGKTTILDYLRSTSVAAGEAGGITQHIGAFSVPLSASGKTITFLDTPGHAAFMSMRQRGANVTDVVILVVAADDSVKPQTLESVRCAREAGVPMIVAVNKVDKEEADVQRVKQDLSRHGVEIEDYGGDVQVVEVSGKTGLGMEELEENVVTLSEILDHRSDTDGAVEGWVLEATTKRAGRVATVLVKRGTLRPGAILVAGNTWTRVRSLRDERDQVLAEVGPGMPVEVDGWRDQPVAGDEVLQAPGEQKATDVVAYRVEKGERLKMQDDMDAINESRRVEQERRKAAEKAGRAAQAALAAGEDPVAASAPTPVRADESTGQLTIPFIIKADVSGSAEAVSAYIPSITSPFIAPTILSSGVGAIHESDVELASAAGGHIIAFNLAKNDDMRGLAESKGVKVLENNIIYRVLEDVKEVLESRLAPILTQKVTGEADIGVVFEIGLGGRKKAKIAGCKVRNGLVSRNARVRVLRGGEKVYDGESLTFDAKERCVLTYVTQVPSTHSRT